MTAAGARVASAWACRAQQWVGWDSLIRSIAANAVIVIGESHHQSGVVALHTAVVRASLNSSLKLHIVTEHFAVNQQPLLDAFMSSAMTFESLAAAYASGDEGFDLSIYRPVLEAARGAPAGTVRLLGGFIPRSVARKFVTQPGERADLLCQAIREGFVASACSTLQPQQLPVIPGLAWAESGPAWLTPPLVDSSGPAPCLEASDAHRSFFASLLSGATLPHSAEEAAAIFKEPGPAGSGSSGGGTSESPLHPRNPSRIIAAQVVKDLSAASVAFAALQWSAHREASGTHVTRGCGEGDTPQATAGVGAMHAVIGGAVDGDAERGGGDGSTGVDSPDTQTTRAGTEVSAVSQTGGGTVSVTDTILSTAGDASCGHFRGNKVVVLCGKGHSDFGFGIPERLLALAHQAACPGAHSSVGSAHAGGATGAVCSYADATAALPTAAPAAAGPTAAAASRCNDCGASALPSILVLSCRDEGEPPLEWGPAFFSDGTSRLPAHFVLPYTPDPVPEDDNN
jgi:hypothetical protein